MKDIVRRQEAEELLGCGITDEQFEEALSYARHKQEYIYSREHREVVLKHWYLVKLTAEYVRNIAFSRFTMELCEELSKEISKELCNMEKEHLIRKEQGAQQASILYQF